MESSFFVPDLRTQLHRIAALVSTASCGEGAGSEGADCRDEVAALRLKMAAVAAILAGSAAGVAVPLAGRERCLGGMFALIKAFSAGVVLATGFVHVLHDAEEALADQCLPAAPLRRFPFAGFVAMLAALGTLAVDLVCTQLYERKLRRGRHQEADASSEQRGAAALLQDSALAEITVERGRDGTDDAMHVAGTSAHASAQRDSHGRGHGHGEATHDGRGHVHGHGHDEEPSLARRVVVAQILELGIVSHSVIIGLSLGVSQSPCTIKPLIAALSFHQFFEGFALGGCISEAQFNNLISFLMAFFFAVTTPAGVILGMGIASFYNSNSPRALVVEGILDSLSAGILIYMALVDLIAADFVNQRMSSCSPKLQLGSYIALFLGAMTMSALAIWT